MAGLSGRRQHVMNLSTHLLKHCKQMRHRRYGPEMSEVAVPGSPGSEGGGGGPAAARICSAAFVSKPFLAPGHPHRHRLSGRKSCR